MKIGGRKNFTLISLPLDVKNFNFAESNFLKSWGAQYCSYMKNPKNLSKFGTINGIIKDNTQSQNHLLLPDEEQSNSEKLKNLISTKTQGPR